jgi:hypothetical protein
MILADMSRHRDIGMPFRVVFSPKHNHIFDCLLVVFVDACVLFGVKPTASRELAATL